MKRIARRLFALLAVISLLVFLANTGFWMRSYFHADIYSWNRIRDYDVQIERGLYRVDLPMPGGKSAGTGTIIRMLPSGTLLGKTASPSGMQVTFQPPTGVPQGTMVITPTTQGGTTSVVSAGTLTLSPSTTAPSVAVVNYSGTLILSGLILRPYVSIHAWTLAMWSLPLPIFWLWLSRRMRAKDRLTLNLCVNCGYDLRASPERCPECGMVRK